MAEISIFDSLVAELSAEERRALLDRIKSHAAVFGDPLFSASAMPSRPEKDYEARVAELGLIARFILFLRGLFRGRSREDLLREDDLKAIAHRLEARASGLVDRHREMLLPLFAEELRKLRDSARFFYDVLDRSVERDRGAFYAFLGSIEMPEVDTRLQVETDPFIAAGTGVNDARALVLDAFDKVFSELPEAGRRAMYRDLRSLLFLKRLSGFLFERLIGVFHEIPGGSREFGGASFEEARDLLLELGDILFSLSEPPSAALIESLFVFVDREEIVKPETDAGELLQTELVKAESALGRIRAFNSNVPLLDILRLVSGDPLYAPRDLPGGEDWLSIFKSFWRERTDRLLDEWKAERRYRELTRDIADFVGSPGAAGFANISREEKEKSPPVGLELALTFLDAFYRGPFLRELNRSLKILLVDGEFYRKENRIEYTDAYDALLRVPERLAAFDARLGPEGELGIAWAAARDEIGSAPMRKKRAQAVARSAEEEAEGIVRSAGTAFVSLVNIVRGILKGEAGGRYDSLANFSYIDGRANKDFVKSLDRAKDRCEKALGLLTDLSGLDLGRER